MMFLHHRTGNYDTAIIANTQALEYYLDGVWDTAWEYPQSFFVIEGNQCPAAFMLSAGIEGNLEVGKELVNSETTPEWASAKYSL